MFDVFCVNRQCEHGVSFFDGLMLKRHVFLSANYPRSDVSQTGVFFFGAFRSNVVLR